MIIFAFWKINSGESLSVTISVLINFTFKIFEMSLYNCLLDDKSGNLVSEHIDITKASRKVFPEFFF